MEAVSCTDEIPPPLVLSDRDQSENQDKQKLNDQFGEIQEQVNDFYEEHFRL